MVSEINIYRAADRVIARHGDEALSEATRQVGRLINRQKTKRVFLWLRIRLAVAILQSPPNRTIH